MLVCKKCRNSAGQVVEDVSPNVTICTKTNVTATDPIYKHQPVRGGR